MQYLSTGPNGASAEYIKYGCTPEAYLGLTYRTKGGFLARAGLDILSIKPRRTGKNSDGVTVKVSDRLTTLSYYVYLQYKKGKFEAKAKSVLSEGGEHMNLMSGYGVSWTGAGAGAWHDGHWEYVPLYASSTWASISYGKKWQIMLMGGYIKNLGTRNPLYGNQDSFVTDRHGSKGDLTDASHVYFSGNGSSNLNEIWRVVPTFAYNIGKFTIALEWNITSARYGDYVGVDGVSVCKYRSGDGQSALGDESPYTDDDAFYFLICRLLYLSSFSFCFPEWNLPHRTYSSITISGKPFIIPVKNHRNTGRR